jgi:hypothetical protein
VVGAWELHGGWVDAGCKVVDVSARMSMACMGLAFHHGHLLCCLQFDRCACSVGRAFVKIKIMAVLQAARCASINSASIPYHIAASTLSGTLMCEIAPAPPLATHRKGTSALPPEPHTLPHHPTSRGSLTTLTLTSC